MILLRTSTEQEIISRLEKICSTEKHQKTLRQFNAKAHVKDRRVPDGTYLGTAHQTICGTEVYVFAQKRSYYYKGTYYGMAVFSELIEVVDPKDGRKGYISPVAGYHSDHIDNFVLFTPHFVKRLEERTGMTLLKYNAEHTNMTMQWVDADGALREDTRYTVFGDMGYAVGGRDDDLGLIRDFKGDKSKFVIARTFITSDMLFKSQSLKMDVEKEKFYEQEEHRKANFHELTEPKKPRPYVKAKQLP